MATGVRAATTSNVARSDTSVEILAAAERHGFFVYNDSNADLYLRFGAGAASTTAFSVKLVAGAFYEGPYSYDGAVQGIWASAGGGAARVTELAA